LVDEVQAVVVGAGVIGLAVARALAARGYETLILERSAEPGSGASSRNSEVIHAGIYYRPGSLKARLCVAGREQLYALCRERGIGHRRCGKLLVASDAAQSQALAAFRQKAADNGVTLEWLDGGAARTLEPQLHCHAALHSPLSGIIDSHAYLQTLLADAEAHGAVLACRSEVTQLSPREHGVALGINGAAPALAARLVVNSAGLEAPALARRIADFPARHIPAGYLAKGSYFTLRGNAPFTRLIYPLPIPGGLGIHLTLDLAGKARFGPDVEWVDRPDYRVEEARVASFYAAVRRYWPALPDDALQPGYAGIRARIAGPGQPEADFRIDTERVHGLPGIVNLFGIESPGLTASLALADEVVARLR
jgi:L-2-hydroxyglutarate oxidase LhgO